MFQLNVNNQSLCFPSPPGQWIKKQIRRDTNNHWFSCTSIDSFRVPLISVEFFYWFPLWFIDVHCFFIGFRWFSLVVMHFHMWDLFFVCPLSKAGCPSVCFFICFVKKHIFSHHPGLFYSTWANGKVGRPLIKPYFVHLSGASFFHVGKFANRPRMNYKKTMCFKHSTKTNTNNLTIIFPKLPGNIFLTGMGAKNHWFFWFQLIFINFICFNEFPLVLF